MRIVEALPERARISEPVLPLVLAALHEARGEETVVLVPDDGDARDLAEAAGWLLGPERVALLPSRGVRWESGLEPPPHLVGERARALDVLAAGGLVFASAAALAEGMPPAEQRPATIVLRTGVELGLEQLAEELALAGYERVERVDDRGQFAVRGGLVDVFPATGREPLRIEFFGDEVEAVRAFSPFTQRALHAVEEAASTRPPSGGSTSSSPSWAMTRRSPSPAVPDDLVPPLDRRPDFVWEPDEVRGVWEELGAGARPRRRLGARPVPAWAALRVRGGPARDRRPRAQRGRERARGPRPRRPPRRGRVRAPRRRAADAGDAAQGRGADPRAGRPVPGGRGAPVRGRAGAPRLRVARPRARPASRHAGVPQARTAGGRAARAGAPVVRRPPRG